MSLHAVRNTQYKKLLPVEPFWQLHILYEYCMNEVSFVRQRKRKREKHWNVNYVCVFFSFALLIIWRFELRFDWLTQYNNSKVLFKHFSFDRMYRKCNGCSLVVVQIRTDCYRCHMNFYIGAFRSVVQWMNENQYLKNMVFRMPNVWCRWYGTWQSSCEQLISHCECACFYVLYNIITAHPTSFLMCECVLVFVYWCLCISDELKQVFPRSTPLTRCVAGYVCFPIKYETIHTDYEYCMYGDDVFIIWNAACSSQFAMVCLLSPLS